MKVSKIEKGVYKVQGYKTFHIEKSNRSKWNLYEIVDKNHVFIEEFPTMGLARVRAVEISKRAGSQMVERINLMSGKPYMERADTPCYLSPAYETYWSM